MARSLLAETDSQRSRTYLFEPGSFRPLALHEQDHTQAGGTTYHYHLDHLGTPRELTDSDGKIVWSAKYRAYGNLALADVEEIDNPLRFQGQYFDAETGLHYNLNRYYDPNAGRFIHQDPIGLEGGANVYRYAPNPVNWIDPLGLVNLNTNSATGNFGVYEIRVDGELYKYGKADLNRVTQSSGLPTRLHQQDRKLADQFGRENVKSKVIEEGYGSTAEAKAAETAKLEEHFEKHGTVPKGNQRSFKPKGDCG